MDLHTCCRFAFLFVLIYFLSFSRFGNISWSIIQYTVCKSKRSRPWSAAAFPPLSFSISMLCNRTKPKLKKLLYSNKFGWIKLNRSSLKLECYHFEKHHIVWRFFQFNGIEPINFRWSLCERCTQWEPHNKHAHMPCMWLFGQWKYAVVCSSFDKFFHQHNWYA